MADGTFTPVDPTFRENYLDEYTQEALPSEHIREAIMDEMCYFNSEVWQGVTLDEARADKDGKILSGQWILSNKGDLESPDCRARYVACEVRTYDDSAFFAATPPLEAKRVLFSQWATERTRGCQKLELHFADTSMAAPRSHFTSVSAKS